MQRTTGQALADPTSGLARTVAQTDAARAERIKCARAIVAREGISLAAAVARVWNAETL